MSPVGSVVIVTFNSGQHIESCLRSVDEPGWERIVVDNASADDSVARARAIPDTIVLANRENRGFAAAANQGAQTARGDLLLFLNPDVVVQLGALAALQAIIQDDSVGIVTGRLLDPDGRTQVSFNIRQLPSLASALMLDILLLNRLWPGNPLNRRYRCLEFDYEKPGEVEQPAGACLLVKRSVWEKVGGFDEQFSPLWFEDVDFCRRVRAVGWHILYEPQARFVHVGGHSVGSVLLRERQVHWYRNLLRYFRKHNGRLAVAVLRGGIFAGMLVRILAVAMGVKPDEGNRRAWLEAYAHVIRDCVFSSIR